jgi:hypothetical protein
MGFFDRDKRKTIPGLAKRTRLPGEDRVLKFLPDEPYSFKKIQWDTNDSFVTS